MWWVLKVVSGLEVNEREKQQKIEVSVIKSERQFAVNFKKQLQWILLAYWRILLSDLKRWYLLNMLDFHL